MDDQRCRVLAAVPRLEGSSELRWHLREGRVTVGGASDLFLSSAAEGIQVLEVSWEEEFTRFATDAEPRLRRALFAVGGSAASDAVADALACAWEHWERVRTIQNPVGYLYRVGRSRLRPRRQRAVLPPVAEDRLPDVEPRLPFALAGLSERQRVTVVLVCGFAWTHEEVAGLLGVSVSTVRNHLARGLVGLRRELGVSSE